MTIATIANDTITVGGTPPRIRRVEIETRPGR
jgi:hypothetical protein